MKWMIFSVLIYPFLFLPTFVLADTVVSGQISSNTTWSPESGVYIINSNFSVASGTTLTIEPGTIIKARNTSYGGPSIYGEIIARGTSESPIYFTSIYDDLVGGDTDDGGLSLGEPGQWQGLYFKEGSFGYLENVVVRYSGYGGYGFGNWVGIENDGGTVEIKNSEVVHNYVITNDGGGGIMTMGSGVNNINGSLIIKNSNIENNHTGIRASGGSVFISNNTIKNNIDHTGRRNGGYGLYSHGQDSITLTHNDFSGNNRMASVDVSKGFIHFGNTSSDLSRKGLQIGGILTENFSLAETNLPYIIQGLTIPEGTTLTVEPGVIIKMDDYYSAGVINVWGGNLIMKGTQENKIYITSLRDDSVGGDTNGDGGNSIPEPKNWNAIFLESGSKADFDNVVIRYGGYNYNGEYLLGIATSIYDRGADFSVKNSLFEHNNGIAIYKDAGVANIFRSEFRDSPYAIYSRGGTITVSQSIFQDINTYGVYNQSGVDLGSWYPTKPIEVIDARNNWWGSADGPKKVSVPYPTGSGSYVSDNVLYEPWLTSEPSVENNYCCSSVIFLPGIKGSVLEKVNATKENDRLWPPAMFSNDVSQLEINENGTSKYPIVVDGIINTFYKTKIYSEFSQFMDGLSAIDENTGTSTIKEWLPLAYDWRFSPEKIINDGVRTKNDGRIDVIERVEELAQNSNTGKVSIVAHSMGGLLGKEIIKRMEELGKSHLIESFVMVGTPQLGTPQAIGSLLHGDGESIVGGMIASKYDMREVGQNMQSAFNLLPSELYFEKVSDRVMKFNDKAGFTEDWRNYWGDSISNYSDFAEFLTGEGVVREEPMSTELLKPEILRSDLLEHSKNLHKFYDEYKMPSNIRVVQVAGWGMPTLKGIEYKNHHRSPSYEALFTKEGDSTVVYPSAVLPDMGEVYYLNLVDYNKKSSLNTQHSNILSAGPTQKIIRCLVKNTQIENIDYVSNYKPQISDLGEQLLVSTHSPVILGAYDGDGNFTGVEPNQDLSLGFLQIKEEIPGSSFVALGDSQYVFLPKEGTYDFVFSGTGNGEVTVEIKNFVDDAPELITSFTDIPVTETSQASFVVEASEPLKTKIQIDEDGDDEIDSLILPDNTNPSLSDLLQILKDKISPLNIKDKIKKNLLKRINNLEKKIERKKEQNVKILERIEKDINNKTKNGRIEVNSAEEVLNIINKLDAVSNSIQLDPDLLLSLKTKIESLSIKPAPETSLIIRVERLEKKQMLTNTLARLNNMINKNQNSGKMSDTDANEIIKILEQIESLL